MPSDFEAVTGYATQDEQNCKQSAVFFARESRGKRQKENSALIFTTE